MDIIKIKPVTKSLTDLDIRSVSVNLDQSAIISGVIYGDGVGESFRLEMDGQTYTDWSSDDEYVVNWVLTQLGLQRA